jgi:hypothetical protein
MCMVYASIDSVAFMMMLEKLRVNALVRPEKSRQSTHIPPLFRPLLNQMLPCSAVRQAMQNVSRHGPFQCLMNP